jgi:hypothetical protein
MLTATITKLEYIDTTPQAKTTPLGEAYTEQVLIDSFVVTFDVIEKGSQSKILVTDHPLWFKPEAIGNRIANYDPVVEHIHAVEALVREVVFGWSPTLEPPDPTNPVDVNGGIDDRIAVEWSPGVDTSVLELHTERIVSAVQAFSPPVIEEGVPLDS